MNTAEYISEFLKANQSTAEPSTLDAYTHRLKRFSEFLVDRQPTKALIREYFTTLFKKDKLSARTVIVYRQTLRAFFNWMVNEGHIRNNPVGKLKNIEAGAADRPTFTFEEYQKLRHAGRDTVWFYAITAAWNTGLRLSDIAMLRWDQVDFEHECLRLTPQKTKRFNKSLEIPMSAELFSLLAEMRLNGADIEFVSVEMATQYRYDQHKSLSSQFIRLASANGVESKSFHCFRHSFVTRLLEAGNTAELVSSITGQTVDQVMSYLHVGLATKRKVMGI